MSDTKIFSLGDQSRSFGGGSAMEGAMLGSMMGNGGMGGGNGMWNNPWWALIFLAAFRNNGGLFGGNEGGGCQGGTQARFDALQEQLSTIQGQNALQAAIQGGTNEVKALASTLNCDINAVQGAINDVQGAICQLGNTMGLGQRDIIAAMNNGNTAIMSKLCDCCCESRLAICQQTNTLQAAINGVSTGLERGFAATNYAFADQTCQIKQAIAEQTNVINDKFCQLEMREMARENRNLRDQVQAFQLSASQQQQTANLIAQLRPCPSPAYVVPNPFGCGCNNYGYPFNGNNCGGCNNGCGC